MSTDLTTTNVLLGIIAAASVILTIGMTIAAYWLLKLAKRTENALASAERTFTPLAIRASACLDDVQALAATAQRAEQSIRTTTERVGRQFHDARTFALGRISPAIGVIRGIAAAVSFFKSRRRPAQASAIAARTRPFEL
jgi:hypothetical protein